MFDLTGKVAIVTGSSRGIGRAIAECMVAHGANVMISSRKLDACEEVVRHIRETRKDGYGDAAAEACNVTYKDQLQSLVDKTRARFGRIDILVCNAAVNPYFGPSAGIPDEAFDKVMNVNIRSNHWLCHMVLPEMVERKDGVIIVISSIGGFRGNPQLSAYGISKAADMALVRNLAVEYGPHNIRVNAIAPGLIRTEFARAIWENPEILDAKMETTPLRRIGEASEIAGAAVFLASAAGSYTTGETMVIDGGRTIA